MKKTLLYLVSGLSILLMAAGCAAQHTEEDVHNIKIAVMDTEDVLIADDSYLNGISMAIEDLNILYEEQGYHISYEFYEDGAEFHQGIAAVNEIISDPEITAVVGTSSLNILDVAADMLDDAGKLLVTYYSCEDSMLENGYTHVFRNCYGERDLGTAIAEYAAQREDISRMAIYHSDTDYERNMVRAFLRAAEGGDMEIVDVATTSRLEPELDTMLERWELLGVDAVFVSQYDAEDAFDILRRIRAINPEICVLGDFSFDYTDYLMENAEVSDNIYIATPVPMEPSQKTELFYERYREKYGAEPTQWAVQLYDSMRMIADTAVRIGSTDSALIAQALRQEGGYHAVGGTLTFDEKGCLIDRYPQIMVSKQGMFQFVEG